MTAGAIENSALWAAYGDALGFITELASERQLQRRLGGTQVDRVRPWVRRIGGRFGPEVELPAGSYSDDTQLRLAVSRAIRGDGRFDAEAFAKIEVPVWRAYALGAGRGTRQAANNLCRTDVTWFSNFFKDDRRPYEQAGGNGAAMRIQPHVWASPDNALTEEGILDLLRNALATHGHMTGLAGAYFHAACLSSALTTDNVPGPDDWVLLIKRVPDLAEIVRSDPQLSSVWVPTWEAKSQSTLENALVRAAQELGEIVSVVDREDVNLARSRYETLLRYVKARDPKTRGSGTKTAALAAILAWFGRKQDPHEVLLIAANALGTDTDTIATMTGAILGAISSTPPPVEVQDASYIRIEAKRLSRLSQGKATETFGYPDLMQWRAPRTQVDTVGRLNSDLALAGLGSAEPLTAPEEGRSGRDYVWQWLGLSFGQKVLAKRRSQPKRMSAKLLPTDARPPGKYPRDQSPAPSNEMRASATLVEQRVLFDEASGEKEEARSVKDRRWTLDTLTDQAIKSGFDPKLIGKHIVYLSERPSGMELCVAYAATIAKARMARKRRSRRERGATRQDNS